MKKLVFIFTLFSFILMACKETKIVSIKSSLVDCQGEGIQKCMQYKVQGEDNWQLFYDEIEGFVYEEGYKYELEVDVEKIDNPPADGSSLKYTLKRVITKEKDVLLALKGPVLKYEKIDSNIDKQEATMPMVEYDSHSRGYYFNITVYNGEYMTFTKQRNAKPVRNVVSKEDMDELKKLITTVDIKGIATLESPTNKRRFDGAPITNITIYSGKEKYKSATFDGGYPPVELEALANKLLSLAPKK